MHRPAQLLSNPRADRVKKVAQLAGRSAVRKRRGQFLVEGPQSAREALRAHLGHLEPSTFWVAGAIVQEVYFTVQLQHSHPEIYGLTTKLSQDVFVAETTQEVLSAMSDAVTHQDIVLVCALPEQPVLQDPGQLSVGMCRVQDPGNAGTIIRVADATGASAVIFTPESVDPFNPKTVRSTAGSLFHLPIYTGVDLETLATASHTNNVQIIATDGYASTTLDTTSTEFLAAPSLWLLGNEAQGLNEQELSIADHRMAIPLYGQAESLNVATAATVCLYASAMAQQRA